MEEKENKQSLQSASDMQNAQNAPGTQNTPGTKVTPTRGILLQICPVLTTIILAAAAIICTSLLANALLSFRKSGNGNGLSATGSASCDFASDLIVWRGSFSVHGDTPKEAYSIIKKDAQLVQKYLADNGVSANEMAFSSVSISQSYTSRYDEEGNYIGDEENGYYLTQSLTVSSSDVDKVENISRDITQLIESGVEFESHHPEYYYTKLDEMKLELIEKATANAKERIDIMAEGSGADLEKLLTANLGVFQITARNSANEGYSSGGTFNTSSRYKTASITVKLNYSVK